MSNERKICRKEDFDERPLEEVWENLYCDPLESDDRVYSLKNKEKSRYQEKNKEKDSFFG